MWSVKMEFHEIANLFPMMTEDRLISLAENIKAEGLHHPLIIYEGKILDGRNRYKACEMAGVEPSYEGFNGNNPWEYVWSENAERRDITDDKRYLIWKKKCEKSEAWEAQKTAIHAEANRKRSESQAGIPKSEMKERACTTSSRTSGQPERIAKAEASRTNRGAVARGDVLAENRPDLADRVIYNDLSMTAALREMKRDALKDKVQDIPSGKYRIIYADPPWSYSNSGLDDYGHAERHYPTMSIDDICNIPIPETEDNAVLFIWVTSPMLEDSFKVIKAWGFKYKTSFVWDKVKHNFGYYNSVRHELLLIATKGSCVPDNKELHDSVVSIERKIHSEKPEEFRKIIDSLYSSGNRIELFARTEKDGWDAWGNEAL
jgi:N6-adenosine-specific RNA methylase IME4